MLMTVNTASTTRPSRFANVPSKSTIQRSVMTMSFPEDARHLPSAYTHAATTVRKIQLAARCFKQCNYNQAIDPLQSCSTTIPVTLPGEMNLYSWYWQLADCQHTESKMTRSPYLPSTWATAWNINVKSVCVGLLKNHATDFGAHVAISKQWNLWNGASAPIAKSPCVFKCCRRAAE